MSNKLIITEFVSLDGVMEAPGGEAGYAHAGWVGGYFSDELGAYKFAEQDATDVLLLGRSTYQSFYGAWPDRDDPMADKINTMRKVVASTTLGTSPWANTEVVGENVAQHIARVKESADGDLLLAGSRTLAHALLAVPGLVDQINLQVFPVILGSGMRFHPDTAEPLKLDLAASREMPNGVLAQTYTTKAA
jgi:dihydrofolate reductase